MVNRSKQKGTAWETDVVRYLQANGFPGVERRTLAGVNDRGDIAGLPRWTLELKAEKQLALATYITEAEREAANAGTDLYAAVVKRRMKGVGDGYVVLPLRVFLKVLQATANPGDDT